MSAGYKLSLQQTQKLVMTQRLQLALKILQLPALELTDYIDNELAENPVLEVISDERAGNVDGQNGDAASPGKLSTEFEAGYDDETRCYDGDNYTSPFDFIASVPTLRDHLRFQLGLTLKNDGDIAVGEYLIDSIDSAGYLRINVDDAASLLGVGSDKAESVLSVIQSFDPPGVGARDLKECLKIQIRQNGLQNKLLDKVVDGYLNEIAENRYAVIAKELSVTPKQAQDIGDIIKRFNPKPGSGFADSDDIKYSIPDVYVDRIGGGYVITVNEKSAPRLSVNYYYKNILKDPKRDKEAAEYIKDKVGSALWLIKSIEQRKSTLQRVVSSIVSYQRDFFDGSTDFLKPMTLENIASEVGVHESTVSRAINGKYVQTPRGLYELRFFFARGFNVSSRNSVSSEKIKSEIKTIIDSECPAKPLSDQKITCMLDRRGIDISRRAVAKYREEMGIPPTSRRKRY